MREPSTPPARPAGPTHAGADPLPQWTGEFGNRYMERNAVNEATTEQASAVFGRIFDAAGIRDSVSSILEVGANVGINLHGLRRELGSGVALSALEPNAAAVARLRNAAPLQLEQIVHGDATSIDLPDNSFDLVFTNGVLIHIPPASLAAVMGEICRVARRFVLCSEYFSHEPVEVPYHGEAGMLWKRDFGREYLETCPQLRVRGYGFVWQEEFRFFDNLNWWVFEKSPHDAATSP
jgi:pseudaminic acid biosynthesis-associated methylase